MWFLFVSIRQLADSLLPSVHGSLQTTLRLAMRIKALHIGDLHSLDNQTNFPVGK
ncbi:MAG: hypothetical protein ABL895_15890 [Cyclobacteriaceae bacterium]